MATVAVPVPGPVHSVDGKRWNALTTCAPGTSSASRPANDPPGATRNTPTPWSTGLVGSMSGTPVSGPAAASTSAAAVQVTASSTASAPSATPSRGRATPPMVAASASAFAGERPPTTMSCPARDQPVASAVARVPVPRIPIRMRRP
nr:hypothetical protein [Virgisporangium ochraceum]